ncbi:hypothetical protein XAC3810_620029 [Xanthomonas citri pv. citri]|uniref:Uncharacterized protein n=1 Tax=Xanthomonas citri pv. citri TaxID=611301 RepID=A0A0U5FHX4_XANCI|nr:hypothetical protein XAC9322_600030 [Xanthomonas citri pv. citri]CEE45169.1 hypothetical protein XAC3810_620029 [Xanthomonas citri pv. citri]CEE48049.1 hypothetical protein XAC908_860030 [Xanthomonas citri pv. citri]CEE50878.1 hypothetical protein XACS584_1050008 [Xanthomonas citri pv. citri]CEE53799.1 hypothetical protein XAC3608_1200008 [Xanthomonas citri pv. citri]
MGEGEAFARTSLPALAVDHSRGYELATRQCVDVRV